MSSRIAGLILAPLLAAHAGPGPTPGGAGLGGPVADAGSHFVIPPEKWHDHITRSLMPFWDLSSAKQGDTSTAYPTYRCSDGKAFGEPGCDLAAGDYKLLAGVNADFRKAAGKDGPYEWITGPKNELLDRTFIRMHSRQTYVYGVAYHITGNEEYLKLAHRGVTWLLRHAIDEKNGSFTYLAGGKPGPGPDYRTSQDQSYTLLGLAFYYYLTRDQKVLDVLTRLKDDVKRKYMSSGWEGGRLIKWVLRNNLEPVPTCLSTIPAPDKASAEQKELVALLDQVNAYMLLTTVSAPDKQREAWLADLHSMAQTIEDRFYNDGIKSQDQIHTGIDPKVPEGMFAGCLTYKGPPVPPSGRIFCDGSKDPIPPPIDPENCDPSNHHTDFGHSIKSFWMLYLIGREKGDMGMEQFALRGADALFPRAYLENGTWARALKPTTPFDPKNPSFVHDRDKEWWIYAELDQMAATMSLRDPARHVPRLNTTYAYWLSSFLEGSEVVQWKYDTCPNADDAHCYNRAIPKANLWKNGFHSMEHGLVAYITTSGVEKKPLRLYYALVTRDTPELRPYYYKASVVTRDAGMIVDAGVKYRKVVAEFTNIR